MKKLITGLFFCLCFSYSLQAQDSCNFRISLLTCSPGEELYSTFGHTALRIQDPLNGADYVFNYGTFEFGPDFYTQFIRGKLLYFLSVESFEDFLYQYRMQSRSIIEQVLQLSCEEKQKLFAALNRNAQEANRYYRYDFLFDNCTTRAKDITKLNTASPVVFKNILPGNIPSFRHLIHSYLDAGHQPWSKLGIDILLGVKLDKKVTNEQAMFLPDYLLKGFDSATKGGQPLVASKQTVLQMPSPLKDNGIFSPMIVFGLLAAVVIICGITQRSRYPKAMRVFDLLFFLLLGLTGVLLMFMWFGTDHIVCRDNFNLLWALPTHLVAAFFAGSSRRWVKIYFTITFWLSLVLAILWFFLPQQMNPALLPIVLLVIYRSRGLSKNRPYAGALHSTR